jgi:hypothetical protein
MATIDHPIWRILEHQGRSLRWLAQKAAVSEALVLSVKAGRRPATEDFRRRCVDALDLPGDTLFLSSDVRMSERTEEPVRA